MTVLEKSKEKKLKKKLQFRIIFRTSNIAKIDGHVTFLLYMS